MNDHAARYKPGRDYAPNWRALCHLPQCSGVVAFMLTDLADEDTPPLRRTTRIAVRADYAQDEVCGVQRGVPRDAHSGAQ